MLNVIMLSVVMTNAVMLSVVMLNVMAPWSPLHHPIIPCFLGRHGSCRNKIICVMVPKVAKAAKVAMVARTIKVAYYMLPLRPQDTEHNDTHHNKIQHNNN
jgi:hypothetical protein